MRTNNDRTYFSSFLLRLALVGDGCSRPCHHFGISEIPVGYRFHPPIQLVEQRYSRRYVEFRYVTVRDVVEIFHKHSDAVPVRGDDDSPACAYLGDDGLFPEGDHPFYGVGQALAAREFVRGKPRVLDVP